METNTYKHESMKSFLLEHPPRTEEGAIIVYCLYTTASVEMIHKQDTKTFPKCYVGRNGKRKQQKLHIQVCGSLKTQRNQGCQG